jgi:hypothetical protein
MSMHIKVEICEGQIPSLIRESMRHSKMNSLPVGKRGDYAKAMKEREEYEGDDDDGDEPMDRGSPPAIPLKKSDFAPEVVKKVMPPMPKGVKASKGKK